MPLILASFKASLFFLLLVAFVLLVSYPVIAFNMFYPEQALMFIANQKIDNWYDLANVYLHPQLLHLAIPFFRPSGHFLIYQLLTPILGWNSNQSLIIINLMFLAAIGILMIRMYAFLFPSLKWGAYIAFALYLMHPSLILSRLIVLHFEFSYIFLSLLSLYMLMLFMQKNGETWLATTKESQTQLKSMHLLIGSLFFFCLAVTFKEAALIMSGALLCYLLFHLYQGQSSKQLLRMCCFNQTIRQLILLIIAVSLTMTTYITLAWPEFMHPYLKNIGFSYFLVTLLEFFKLLFGFGDNYDSDVVFRSLLSWRVVVFPLYSRVLLWLFLPLGFFALNKLFTLDHAHSQSYLRTLPAEKLGGNPAASLRDQVWLWKRSCVFLIIAALIVLILPLRWAMGLPWHLSQTLVFLSLLWGFCVEYIVSLFLPIRMHKGLLLLIAFVIGVSAYGVNQTNIDRFNNDKELQLSLKLNRNAVLHPPKLKGPLDDRTLVVVADPIIQFSYMLGAAQYPYQAINDLKELQLVLSSNQFVMLKADPNHSGNLFKWGYRNANIQEELVPLDLYAITEIPNELIYEWMTHFEHLFFITYDNDGNWIDQTTRFKEKLRQEVARRKIHLNHYKSLAITGFTAPIYNVINLAFGDVKLCKYACSQDVRCNAFNFVGVDLKTYSQYQCQLLAVANVKETKLCTFCAAYLKDSF